MNLYQTNLLIIALGALALLLIALAIILVLFKVFRFGESDY